MLLIAFWSTLSYLAYFTLSILSVLCVALAGHLCGIRIERLLVGSELFDRCLVYWRIQGWELRLGAVPFGARVDFLSQKRPLDKKSATANSPDMIEPSGGETISHTGTLEAASWLVRTSLLLAIPVYNALLVIVLLSVAVTQQTGQLRLRPGENGQLSSSAAPGLRIGNEPTTWPGQWALCSEFCREVFGRFVLFQPLNGWGGLIAWMTTCGAAIQRSPTAWCTLIALSFLTQMAVWMFWTVAIRGALALKYTVSKFANAETAEIWQTWSLLTCMLGFLVVYIRVVCADVIWFVGM